MRRNKLTRIFWLFALSAATFAAGCVSNKYPCVNADGTQRQIWGDEDFGKSYWAGSEMGKQIKAWNAKMDQFYATNNIKAKP
jgi:hypothetical protein